MEAASGVSFAERYGITTPAQTSHVNEASSRLLLHAAQEGDPATVQALLVEAGANPTFRNALGETSLHVAAGRGVAAVTEVLLRYGADPNVAMEERYGGRTPLHVAVRARDARAVTLLLEFGADANAPDSCGRLPLHEAAAIGDEACVRSLLSRGSVPTAADNLDRTPLMHAKRGGHARCAAAIAEAVSKRVLTDDDGPQKHDDGVNALIAAFPAQVEANSKRIVWREKKPPPKGKR